MADDTRPDEGPDHRHDWNADHTPRRCPRPGCGWGSGRPDEGPDFDVSDCVCSLCRAGQSHPAPPAPAVPVTAPDDTLRREVERLRRVNKMYAEDARACRDRMLAALAAREDTDQGARAALARVEEVCAQAEADYALISGGNWASATVAVSQIHAALARDTAEPGGAE